MRSKPPAVPVSEWIIAVISAVFLIGCVVILLRSPTNSPPVVVAEIEKITQTEAGFLLRAKVSNRGDEPAAQVRVRAVLAATGPGGPETKETLLDYVPAHSVRRIGFYFLADPREGRVKLQADSFVQP